MGRAEDFLQELQRVGNLKRNRLAGQPADNALADTIGVQRQTVGNWLKGSVSPSDRQKLLSVIDEIRATAKRLRMLSDRVGDEFGGTVGELLDRHWWDARYTGELELRSTSDAVSAGVRRQQAEVALATVAQVRVSAPVGRLIAEYDDRLVLDDLEVHTAVDSEGANDRLSLLPPYVPRDPDDRLRAVVTGAVRGYSNIAILIGGSSTGKSRAAWEAVAVLPPHWRLWHPIVPDRASALIEGLDRVLPCTVIWLNESQQ
ncbi:hypothetical protein [Streptomyces sp. NPDC059828]|uniref:hypothetical protein n=1 Tax=Streptomyces sp. NPDC059828 TaxID=3346965 RepID=UPI003669003F